MSFPCLQNMVNLLLIDLLSKLKTLYDSLLPCPLFCVCCPGPLVFVAATDSCRSCILIRCSRVKPIAYSILLQFSAIKFGISRMPEQFFDSYIIHTSCTKLLQLASKSSCCISNLSTLVPNKMMAYLNHLFTVFVESGLDRIVIQCVIVYFKIILKVQV